MGHANGFLGLVVGANLSTANTNLNNAAFRFTTMHKAGAPFPEMGAYQQAYNQAARSAGWWSSALNSTKLGGQGFFVVSAGVNLYQGSQAMFAGDWLGVLSPGADLTFGAMAATGNPFGMAAGASYTATSWVLMNETAYNAVVTQIVDFACAKTVGC